MTTKDFVSFVPKPIDVVGIRAGDGPSIKSAFGIIQRTTALRAYNSFGKGRDWMEELATAYIVALATRSADRMLMEIIKCDLANGRSFACRRCMEASIGHQIIRKRLFPRLEALREHANKLVHHLDDPANRGVEGLDIEGVFDYCHHLYQDNAEALFGTIPDPTGQFSDVKCKKCLAPSP